MWLEKCNRYFCKIENFVYIEFNERSFSIPTPGRQQAIALNNLLLTGPHANKIVEILIKIQQFSNKKLQIGNIVCKKAAMFSGSQCVS